MMAPNVDTIFIIQTGDNINVIIHPDDPDQILTSILTSSQLTTLEDNLHVIIQ
jgi:hypothetical protein